MSFWDTVAKPCVVLAPLANVTDPAFRRIIAKYSGHMRGNGTYGGPDVMWTEFVSADGLVRATEEGKRILKADLQFDQSERPIVAQLFSAEPAHMEQAARLCRDLGFDGIDINMGCPDRAIERQGCGSAMIKNPKRAQEVIYAAQKGAGELPVSVKTRIGYNRDEIETWIPALLAAHPAAITVHARTRKEMSKVPARFEHVAHAVCIRNAVQDAVWQSAHPGVSRTLILGNGDIKSVNEAHEKSRETGADGVMIGRAIFGTPWFFNPTMSTPSIAERLAIMCEHTELFVQLLPHKNFAHMKKHYSAYVEGFDGAKELRMRLMEQQTPEGVRAVVNTFLNT